MGQSVPYVVARSCPVLCVCMPVSVSVCVSVTVSVFVAEYTAYRQTLSLLHSVKRDPVQCQKRPSTVCVCSTAYRQTLSLLHVRGRVYYVQTHTVYQTRFDPVLGLF